MRCLILFSFLALTLHAADPLPGHSTSGEAFDAGPRQAAVLILGCGKVSFPITSKNISAQAFFNQGVGQLHGFWYYEAERSFRQVALLDPDCAMAYWGCAMANVGNEKRAVGFIKKAVEKKTGASKREQAWIGALDGYYTDVKKEKKSRQMEFIKATEDIISDFPDDLEAKAFLAWAIWHAKEDGVPLVSREAVDAIIGQVLAKEPLHPVHHYRIHLWDDSRPARAVASAAQCGQSAPAIAHMWHMPGHTFSKVDREDDAAWQQEAATRVDHAYMIRTQILPDQIHNYAHNTEWLIRTLNQTGAAHQSIALAKSLVEIPRHPDLNPIEKDGHSAAYGRTRLLETLLKYELWDDVLALDGSPFLDVTQNPSFEATRLRALGVAAFFKGDEAKVKQQFTALKKMLPKTETKTDHKQKPQVEKTEDAQKAESKDSEPTNKAAEPVVATNATADKQPVVTHAADKNVRPANTSSAKKANIFVENAVNELAALVAMMKPDNKAEAVKLLDQAKETPKDRQIRYRLKMDDKDKATALAANLPNDVPGLALRTETLLHGKQDDAKKAFESLRKLASSLDDDLPVSRRMSDVAVKLGFDKAWKLPAIVRADSGVRPPIESLGPLLWHPWAALPFELQSNQERTVSLHDFAGTPVVVLFYLGGTCEQCVKQLKAFAAAGKDFKAAGIEIAAIGTEVAADLQATQKLCSVGAAVPFPLLADPELKTFKAYRCFDDFEQKPLHGTFLVDGAGQVRWLDVSYEPFQDAQFLLKEAKRLLRFDRPLLSAK